MILVITSSSPSKPLIGVLEALVLLSGAWFPLVVVKAAPIAGIGSLHVSAEGLRTVAFTGPRYLYSRLVPMHFSHVW